MGGGVTSGLEKLCLRDAANIKANRPMKNYTFSPIVLMLNWRVWSLGGNMNHINYTIRYNNAEQASESKHNYGMHCLQIGKRTYNSFKHPERRKSSGMRLTPLSLLHPLQMSGIITSKNWLFKTRASIRYAAWVFCELQSQPNRRAIGWERLDEVLILLLEAAARSLSNQEVLYLLTFLYYALETCP